MSRAKAAILIFSFLFLAAPVAADWVLVVEQDREYGERIGIGLVCGDGSCSGSFSDVTMCGRTDNWDALPSGTWWHEDGNSGVIWQPKPANGHNGRVKVPGNFPCSRVVEASAGGETYVNEELQMAGGMDSNKGYYIVTRFGKEADAVEDFFLTNTPWYDCDGGCGWFDFNEFPERGGDDGDPTSGPRPIEKGAFFLASERDPGLAVDKSDEGIAIAEYGEVINPYASLQQYVWSNYSEPNEGWACAFTGAQSGQNECEKDVWQVLGYNFDGGYDKDYDNECSVAQNNFKWDECAPLHDGGTYEPQGDIIVASEMDKSNFQDWSDYPFSIDPDTYFFVCRGDYKGSNIEESKIVKVQYNAAEYRGTDWQWRYYRCTENNNWVQAECDPGTHIGDEDNDDNYECYIDSTETVVVNLFNINNVSSTGAQDGFIAGFKINSSEMNNYNDLMEKEIERIDAECWMGNNDERPSDESKAGQFRVEYDGFGDAWVLGEIPYRESVNNKTYSCVWGFSEPAEYSGYSPGGTTLLDHGIYESTKYEPLRSVDGGRIDMNYTSEVIPEYSNLVDDNEVDESITRNSLWFSYSSGDTRDYVDDTVEDMFAGTIHHPYCNTPSSPNNILDHIICN